jgi:asparagine synthase (glutamine-hydrolysing)
MSGLAVLATFDGTPVEPSAVDRLTAAAPYRAADGIGCWFGPGVGLAQQLLRTVPGEPADPIVDAELVVVADLRLDNRPELFAALELDDDGRSDAALLTAAYRRWGTGCIGRLLGDFAFAIWDDAARRLVAARDPMAMRSLAYHVRPRRQVVVATEVKQVLAAPGVPDRIDERAVGADLIGHFGRPDWSSYEEVSLLAPGHVLEVDREGPRVWPFWSPDPGHRIVHRRAEDYAEHLRQLFVQAVSDRMRTDVPVGILLSGGVDSGSVAATAGWLSERGATPAPAVHACTWAFDELVECDERDVARLIVDRFGLGWSQVPVDHLGPLAGYPAHGPPRDEPFVGAFQPAIDALLVAARDAGARVILGGDRGDLAIGWTGTRHLPLLRHREFDVLREELTTHQLLTGQALPQLVAAHLLRPAATRLRQRVGHRWQRLRTGDGDVPAARSPVPSWVQPAFAARVGLDHLPASGVPVPPGFGPTRGLRFDWVFTQLHLRGMAWSERSYAEQGLVFADPFGDRRLVEFVLAVPQAALTTPGDNGKPLMRAAMRGILPEPARRGARKVVPEPLFDRGLSRDGASTVRQLLDCMQAEERGWLDAAVLRGHHDRYLDGALLAPTFWRALVVEWWLRTYATTS